jgi:hypothetical protein
MNCTAQRGFLTLSGCENPASTLCAGCGAPRCAAHLSPQCGFTKCFTCANLQTTPATDDETYDDDWSYRYRTSYYSDSGYRPVHSYDQSDASGFNDSSDDLTADDRDEASFGDS